MKQAAAICVMILLPLGLYSVMGLGRAMAIPKEHCCSGNMKFMTLLVENQGKYRTAAFLTIFLGAIAGTGGADIDLLAAALAIALFFREVAARYWAVLVVRHSGVLTYPWPDSITHQDIRRYWEEEMEFPALPGHITISILLLCEGFGAVLGYLTLILHRL